MIKYIQIKDILIENLKDAAERSDIMKIEKVNDHQIRCTLTKADLADRELKISELAYGTEKAKSLFRDMMQQASYQFGFEAEDIPLMIEAIPLSGDAIVLIITKVEDPEELDTRFSKFAPSVHEDNDTYDSSVTNNAGGADDVIDLFRKLRGQAAAAGASQTTSDSKADSPKEVQIQIQVDLTKMYSFSTLDEAIQISHVLKGLYSGENALYKSSENGRYFLIMKKSDHTPEQFNKICNMLTEYAKTETYTPATESFLKEHSETIISSHALEKLALI